jgi:NAD-dependent deacetylase
MILHSEQPNFERLADWLKESRYTMVLTGAGMSTESGVPDFRSKNGWWQNIDPRTVAAVAALQENYPLFHEFYSRRIKGLEQVKPHQGHYVLSDWQRRGLIQTLATQNVDGLHQHAGSLDVFELHGSIHSVRCHDCEAPAEKTDFLQGIPCRYCSGPLRPDVVLFGEMLPEDVWNAALAAVSRAELLLVIGTSLQVYPVNQLPALTLGRVAILNAEPTEMDSLFDLAIHGQAGNLLQAIDQVLSM